MTKQKFVNREHELKILKDAYNSDRAEFIIVYGRRRIGKTELLKQSKAEEKFVYFFVEEALEEENLNTFKDIVAGFLSNPLIAKAELSWLDLFNELAKVDNLVLIFDEFPNLVKKNKRFLSQLQKIWDELLADTTIKLVVCGSSISLMETHLLGYQSPLYGRRTGQILLPALKYYHLKEFIELPVDDIIRIYGITDGIPYYILDAAYMLKNNENLEDIFRPGRILFEEAEILIKYELRDPTRYYKILKAISFGYTKFGDIATYTGFSTSIVSQYLSNLIKLHIIEDTFPIGERKEKTRNRRYTFSDNYFQFYFRFIYPHKSELLETGRITNFDAKFNQYMGTVFEKVCTQFLLLNRDRLPFAITKLGRWWHKDKEIDVVALDEESKEIGFFECKYSTLKFKDAFAILAGLKNKSGYVDWNCGKRKEYFGLIAKKIEDKERLRKEGYFIFDFDDF